MKPTDFKLPTAAELAQRLNILMDHVEIRRGEPYTYAEVHDYLTGRGITLSRSRWSYMLRGEIWRVKDRILLDALADLFETPREYLYNGQTPETITADMKPLIALRVARVRADATRNLTGIAPNALRTILKTLDELNNE